MQTFTPVTLSKKAAEEVKYIMENKNIPEGYGLRIGVRGGGGCGGASYMLGFDQLKTGDMTYEQDGITILVEKKQTLYLAGVEVDFYEGSDARGFRFVHPGEKEVMQTGD